MSNKINDWILGRTFFEYLAYFFLIIGIVLFVLIPSDYNYPNTLRFIEVKSIGDLGTILSGTSGVLWALAGVLLFFSALKYQRDDLKLQREELSETRFVMKEQGETLKLQTAESTFFRLLENHRNLVNSLSFDSIIGYQGLNSYYKTLKENTVLYKQAALTGEVGIIHYGNYYPIWLMTHQIENIEQIASNSLHLIDLINRKLNDDIFYHRTFYNSLSKPEKYILGLYTVNLKLENVNLFKRGVLNYLEYFENSGNSYYDKNTMPYFPYVDFQFETTKANFSVHNFHNNLINQNIANLEIKVLKNELLMPMTIKKTLFIGNSFDVRYKVEEEWGLQLDSVKTINIFGAINERIFEVFVSKFPGVEKNTYMLNCHFTFELLIEYNGKEYNYKKKFSGNFTNVSEYGSADFFFQHHG